MGWPMRLTDEEVDRVARRVIHLICAELAEALEMRAQGLPFRDKTDDEGGL
jgi:hypothetical protein